MPAIDLPHRVFTRFLAWFRPERRIAMADLVVLLIGLGGFALVAAYVAACERI